jgi:hypothetical protein
MSFSVNHARVAGDMNDAEAAVAQRVRDIDIAGVVQLEHRDTCPTRLHEHSDLPGLLLREWQIFRRSDHQAIELVARECDPRRRVGLLSCGFPPGGETRAEKVVAVVAEFPRDAGVFSVDQQRLL